MLYALFPKVIQNCSLDQEFSDVVNSSVQFILHYENILSAKFPCQIFTNTYVVIAFCSFLEAYLNLQVWKASR